MGKANKRIAALKDADAATEIDILRGKLDDAELKLNNAGRVAMETDLKIHAVMRRLLTANDVKGDRAMRVNILEQMNDLKRDVNKFFVNAGLIPPNG